MTEKIRVLLIEDSPEDAKFTAIQLKQSFGNDYQLDTCDYFSKASELLSKNTFDIIILDLCLPDAKGLNAFKDLLNSSRTPVIIYTGLKDELIKSEATKAGASDYLIKGETNSAAFRESIITSLEKAQYQQD
ncbi:MAG: response regulator [Bacteroidota bacterium]|nr:response regulator [Bacteroidota bacterium]